LCGSILSAKWRVQEPTLVIHGANDPLVLPTEAESLARAASQAPRDRVDRGRGAQRQPRVSGVLDRGGLDDRAPRAVTGVSIASPRPRHRLSVIVVVISEAWEAEN